MHTYRRVKQEGGLYLYVVGFDTGDTETNDGWRALIDFAKEHEAQRWVSYLNGGDNPSKPWPAETI